MRLHVPRQTRQLIQFVLQGLVRGRGFQGGRHQASVVFELCLDLGQFLMNTGQRLGIQGV